MLMRGNEQSGSISRSSHRALALGESGSPTSCCDAVPGAASATEVDQLASCEKPCERSQTAKLTVPLLLLAQATAGLRPGVKSIAGVTPLNGPASSSSVCHGESSIETPIRLSVADCWPSTTTATKSVPLALR